MTHPSWGGQVARHLAGICGPEFARAAGPADGVAGASARWVAAPGTVDAVAAVLRLAGDYELTVVPRGAGTKIDWGAPPSRVDIVLDTGRLAGVWHQPASEPIAEVGAGTPVRAVQAVLERTGRRLALDVPSPGATIGGMLAADEAGPLRYRHGSPCEQLVEVGYLDAAGVLRRVAGTDRSGADLARLLCGSQGALGVLVSATLRVHSMPPSRIWVSRPVRTPHEVHHLVGEILAASLAPAAIEVDLPGPAAVAPAGPAPAAGRLVVLLEGGPADVAERAARLATLLGEGPDVATVPPVWWRRYPFGPGDVGLRISAPTAHLHAAVYALRDAVGTPVPVRGSAGVGLVHAALPGNPPPERVAEILAAVRGVLLARDGRCVVLAAPPEVRRAVDIWGHLPDLPLLHRIKERFDPARRLAPGRFTGGL
nr:FAD-binding oxidoreductase [Micromonospora sp. DSM 115978]